MTMWNHLTPRNLLAIQREAALRVMGEEAAEYLAAGDGPAADRILDEMIERRRAWEGT